MKNILFTVLFLILGFKLFAQVPQSFNYQAVLRDASGNVLANQDVEIEINLIQDTVTNVSVFSETHSVTTNQFGLVNLQIGSVNTADMENLDWSAGPYFIQISVDGTVMGTSQLLSVPFAMHAKTVEIDKVDDADADPTNELQDISLSGTQLSITKGSTVDLSLFQDGTGTDNQRLYFENNVLRISRGNSVTLPYISAEQDGDPTNELQVLSISNDTIYLTDGGKVILPAETDPIYTSDSASLKTAIAKNQQAIIDTAVQIRASIPDVSNFLTSENDPDFNTSTAANISDSDIAKWNGKVDTLIAGTGILIVGDTIKATGTGAVLEQDPVYAADSALLKIAIARNQQAIIDTAAQIRASIPDVSNFLTSENDPDFNASTAANISDSDVAKWNCKVDTLIAGTGILIVGDTIKATGTGAVLEQDPVYAADSASLKTAISKNKQAIIDTAAKIRADMLTTELDPVFTAWDKSTGIEITEAQITDLDHFTNSDETDPVFDASVAAAITSMDTASWNRDISATNELQALSISNDTIYLSNGGFVKLPSGVANSLDAAYDNGKYITADSGAVTIAGTDGLISTGKYGQGDTLSVSGAGTRMLWFPKKAAFRVGAVDDTQWDDDNMGDYSFAAGYRATASGLRSIAMGGGTTAGGDYSFATGRATTASGDYSTAMGYNTTASGNYSTAMGYETKASRTYSTAIGYSTTASGDYGSTAMGYSTTASGDYGSTAMGYLTTASGNYGSIAMGYSTTASGINSTAIGWKTSASYTGSIAIGSHIKVSGYNSVGIGLDDNTRTLSQGKTMAIMGGKVGINNLSPTYKLDVDGTGRFTGDGYFDGKVGIGNTSPTYRLDVDGTGHFIKILVDGTGYFTNVSCSSDAIFKGKVGIGTTDPAYPLEVNGHGSSEDTYAYFQLPDDWTEPYYGKNTAEKNYSISASSRVKAYAFHAVSDRRIKTNIQQTRSKADLDLVNKIQVVDYQYIDKVEKGDITKKGFIAQQVEEVLPNAVGKSSQFIPDIYKKASKVLVDSAANTLIVTTPVNHNLKAGDQLRFITLAGKHEEEVLSVLSDSTFTVKKVEGDCSEVFVYGKKVDDFRAIDYDQVFSVGIGAIQELDRQNKEQEQTITALQQTIENLQNENIALKNNNDEMNMRLATLEALVRNTLNAIAVEKASAQK